MDSVIDRLMKIQDELLAGWDTSILADPVSAMREDARLAQLVDSVVLQVMAVARQAHTDMNFGAEMSRRDVLDAIIQAGVRKHGSESLWAVIRARWSDTLSHIVRYEDKSLPLMERVRSKPVLKQRGLL